MRVMLMSKLFDFTDCSFSASCKMNPEALDILKSLSQPLKTGDTVNVKGVKLIQKRKHRKRRINKKWAKRYGYREIPTDYGDFQATVESTEESGVYSVELTRGATNDN